MIKNKFVDTKKPIVLIKSPYEKTSANNYSHYEQELLYLAAFIYGVNL